MALRWSVVSVVVLALSHGTGAQTKCTLPEDSKTAVLPDFTDVLKGSYSMILEMTIPNENKTIYVEQNRERRLYQDSLRDSYAVQLTSNGTTVVFHYLPEVDTFVEEYDAKCDEIGTEPPFHPWGWYDTEEDHESYSYGPSSILRLANILDTRHDGTQETEGVLVDQWKACGKHGEKDVEIFFYFAREEWTMPEEGEFQPSSIALPVAMEVIILDDVNSWVYSFVDFVPSLRSPTMVEPPRGLSCEGQLDTPGVKKPSLPMHFSFAEEVIVPSVVDGRDMGVQHIDKLQITYVGELSVVAFIATLPYDEYKHHAYPIRFVHDFNTGVQYAIFKEFGNCSRDRIPPYSFDSHYGGFLGTGDMLLSPDQMFHLDGDYYYAGERKTRAIDGNMWTSLKEDEVPDPSTGGIHKLPKAVFEYYFSKGLEIAPSGATVLTNLPFRGDFFVYNKTDQTQIEATVTTNFYDFSTIDIFSPQELSVEECFEKDSEEWSHLVIYIPSTKDNQVAAALKKPDLFKHKIFAKLLEIGRMSPVRIASIDVTPSSNPYFQNVSTADYFIVEIKLLDKAPAILAFIQPEDELDNRPGVNELLFTKIRDVENCAEYAMANSRAIKSFHHCQIARECYLSESEHADGEPVEGIEIGDCKHFVYNVHNQSVPDYPSQIVYQALGDAIRLGEFSFVIPYKNKNVSYEAISSLHYRTPDPLDLIRVNFVKEMNLRTVRTPNDTVNSSSAVECMVRCLAWRSYTCETIVFEFEEKKCLILDRHFPDIDPDELVPHDQSTIYTRSYLVDYTPVIGVVSINSSGLIYENVSSIESCARMCSNDEGIDCMSFDYCFADNLCSLHEDSFMDVVDGGDYTEGSICMHFSKSNDKIFKKYGNQGLDNSLHNLVSINTSPSECAKLCLDDMKEVCQSYDYCSACGEDDFAVCDEENNGTRGLCFLAGHHLGEIGLQLTTAPSCDHYSREQFGSLDYASWLSEQQKAAKPYSPGDMAGLAFGMIALGLLLAVVFLAIMTKVKPAAVPKDFEINFVTLKPSGDSES